MPLLFNPPNCGSFFRALSRADVAAQVNTADDIHGALVVGDNRRVKELLDRDPGYYTHQLNSRLRTPLHTACGLGQPDKAQTLISRHADVDATDIDGRTPLLLACMCNNSEDAHLLLQNQASARIADSDGVQPLHWVAQNGDTVLMQQLLSQNADVSAVDCHGRTPLHAAARARQYYALHLLLEWRANVHAVDNTKRNALHYAALKGWAAETELLVCYGADTEAHDQYGKTPRNYAEDNGHKAVLKKLYGKASGVTLCPTTLRLGFPAACQNLDHNSHCSKLPQIAKFALQDQRQDLSCQENPRQVECLVEQGAGDDAKNTSYGTPLHDAVLSQDYKEVDKLLESGANPNACDENARRPLHISAGAGLSAIADLLCEKKASVNVVDDQDRTPLHYSLEAGFPATTGVLLRHGADPNAADKWGKTPLHVAAEISESYHFYFTIQNLLKMGAEKDNQDANGNRPIHLALKSGSSDAARLLIQWDCELNATNHNNESPLFWAAARQLDGIVDLLLRKGASPDQATKDNQQTALHVAASNGSEVIVSKLLAQKDPPGLPPLCAVDSNDRTPLDCAVQHGHIGVVEQLLRAGIPVHGVGENALHMCAQNEFPDIARQLLVRCADTQQGKRDYVNGEDCTGHTALYYAIVHNHIGMVKLLLQNEAQITESEYPRMATGVNPGNDNQECYDKQRGCQINLAIQAQSQHVLNFLRHGQMPSDTSGSAAPYNFMQGTAASYPSPLARRFGHSPLLSARSGLQWDWETFRTPSDVCPSPDTRPPPSQSTERVFPGYTPIAESSSQEDSNSSATTPRGRISTPTLIRSPPLSPVSNQIPGNGPDQEQAQADPFANGFHQQPLGLMTPDGLLGAPQPDVVPDAEAIQHVFSDHHHN